MLVLTVLVLMALAGCGPQETAAPPRAAGTAAQQAPDGGPSVNLPKQAGQWVRPDAPRRITADNIFDYMDGGGELYLAYRFDHLDVYEYKAADSSLGTILVELYWMRSPDDAFGLLSTDWGGETVRLDEGGRRSVPLPDALYGAGLLRLRSGDLYARVLASRESPAAREQVLALGRAIVAGREVTDPPPLLRMTVTPRGWRLNRPVFFRSHLVLNSAYFLASDDILGLSPDVEGLTSELAGQQQGTKPARLIMVMYPAPERAEAGLRTFTKEYLPEAEKASGGAAEGSAKTEQGWAAYRRRGRALVIVLDGPSREAALALVRSQTVQ